MRSITQHICLPTMTGPPVRGRGARTPSGYLVRAPARRQA